MGKLVGWLLGAALLWVLWPTGLVEGAPLTPGATLVQHGASQGGHPGPRGPSQPAGSSWAESANPQEVPKPRRNPPPSPRRRKLWAGRDPRRKRLSQDLPEGEEEEADEEPCEMAGLGTEYPLGGYQVCEEPWVIKDKEGHEHTLRKLIVRSSQLAGQQADTRQRGTCRRPRPICLPCRESSTGEI